MRKIFATLKSVVAAALVVSMTLAVSCSYDDTPIKNDIKNLKGDLAKLTERVNALENKSIDDLLNGAAVITDVTVNETTGDTVITLSNGKTVTVLAEAEALQYRVTDGVLEISADGQTWVAVTAAPEAVVKSVVVNEDGTVTITLADETQFTVAKAELIECEATRSGVYVPAGEYKDVRFTINDAVVDINIMNQPLGWSATVEEYVEVEDDDFGGGMMPLAVGGKDYVVRINAPDASFEAAATEGVVSVHFNTAAGACKVLSINVNIAKLTFEVDKRGNITIVNSLVEKKGNYMIGYHDDFANFFLGIVYKSDFEEYGSIKGIANYGAPYSMIARDNLVNLFNKPYEVGVYEEDVTKFTVEELFAEFASVSVNDVTYTVGNDYVVFMAMADEYGEADLNRVEALDYTALKVVAEKVEGSETWNGADYKFTFMGYDAAVIGYVPQSEVDMSIELGRCSDLNSFYDLYIANAENQGFPVIGTPITFDMGPWENQLITAAELSQFYGAILPNTEYRLYALCLNFEDVGVKTFTHEDIYDFGTFTTTGLEAGDFAVVAESELVSWDNTGVKANITLSENVALSTYEIYYEPAVDVELRIEEMMEFAYFQPNPVINVYQYVGDREEIYVAIIGVNADGQYAFEEVKFSKPIVYTEFVYNQADFTDGVLTLKGETNKDAIAITVNPGLEALVAGDYVAAAEDWTTGVCQVQWSAADAKEIFANATTFDYTGNPNSYPHYATADFKMNIAVEGDVYTIVATDKISGLGHVKFSFTGTFGIEEEESAAVVFTSATAVLADGQPNWHDITFANGTDTVVIRIATYGTTKCLYGKYAQRDYGQDCCINGYPTTSTWNGVSLWPVTMDVADNGDGTLSVVIEATEYGGNGDSHVGTFTGVIEGLTFEKPEVAPEFTIPGDGVNYELELRYTKLVDGLDAANAVRVADDNGYTWDIKFNTGLSSIEPGDYKAVNAFTTADALEVDTYNGGVGYGESKYMYVEAYSDTTINVQKNGDWYCITLICTNGAGCYDCPVTGAFRVVYIGKIVK